MKEHLTWTYKISNFLKWLIRTTYIPLVLIVLLSVDTGKASSINFQANIGTVYLFHHTAETERKTRILSVFSPIEQTNQPAPGKNIPHENVAYLALHYSGSSINQKLAEAPYTSLFHPLAAPSTNCEKVQKSKVDQETITDSKDSNSKMHVCALTPPCGFLAKLTEVLENQHMKVARLSALHKGHLHPQEKTRHLYHRLLFMILVNIHN
jgi:hypothetical protein